MKIETIVRITNEHKGQYKKYKMKDYSLYKEDCTNFVTQYAKEKLVQLKAQNLNGFLENLALEQYYYIGILFSQGKIAGQTLEVINDSIQDILMIGDAVTLFGEHFMDELLCALLNNVYFEEFFYNINNNTLCLPKQSISLWKKLIRFFLRK